MQKRECFQLLLNRLLVERPAKSIFSEIMLSEDYHSVILHYM